MARVLIVDPDARTASFLEHGLRAAGHDPHRFIAAANRYALVRDDDFDLVVVDVASGLDAAVALVRSIRMAGQTVPVILLAGPNGIDGILSGFQAGADDYLRKPFAFEDFLDRVSARLVATTQQRKHAARLHVGGHTLDLQAHTLFDGEQVHELSSREFALAHVFFTSPGHVLSREQLLSRVWGYDFDPGSNVVDVYVGYLRRKLAPGAIETVRGMGYRLLEAARQ